MAGAKKKPTGKTAAKKTPSKASGTKKAKKSAPPRGNSGRNPIYILIIMGLLTVILVMVNRFLSEHDTGHGRSIDSVSELFRIRQNDPPPVIEGKKNATEKDTASVTVDEKTGMVVKVYFLRLNEKTEKFYLTPVIRRVTAASPLESTMSELIHGPSAGERNGGLLTAVPAGLKIRSISVKNSIAKIDFDESIGEGAAGNILISRIDQLVYTATQFDRVDSVVITINGRRRKSLGSDGLSIGGPIHRR